MRYLLRSRLGAQHALAALLALTLVTPAAAQPTINALRANIGTTGSTCTIHSGTGTPGGALGAVCDTYIQKDSPYTTFTKTGPSTWTPQLFMPTGATAGDTLTAASATAVGRVAAVGVGSVLASNGTGVPPIFTASPSLTSIGAASNLTLSPTGDLVLAPTGLDILPDTGYTKNLGALTNKFLTLHVGELWAETLVAQNTIATIGGRVLVGPTTTLTSDLSSGATSMVVKHNQLSNGDRVVLQVNNSVEWLAVTSGPSGSGPYTYSITRNLDGSGANAWAAGDAVFNTGTTNNGFIDLYSVAGLLPGSTAGPTIVGNVRTGTTYSQVAPRWAIGNLNGLYGYSSSIYGAAFGDASTANVTIDATNGLRIRNNTTNLLHADISGNLRIGNPSGNRLVWNGTTLELVSDNLTIDSSGVRIAPSTSTTFSNTRGYTFTTTTGPMGVFGFDSPGAGRHTTVRTDWSGVGNYSGTLLSSIGAAHQPSSGGTNYSAIVASTVDPAAGTAFVQISATTYADFSADLRIYHNNGSTTLMPYYRSDGNYSVFNSRPAANGGAFYLNNDVNADLYLSYGGGNTWVSNTRFVNRPQWENGLAQLTVGATGTAAALPPNPAGYLQVKYNGVNLLIPAYNP